MTAWRVGMTLPVDMRDGSSTGRTDFLSDWWSGKLSTSYAMSHAHLSHNASRRSDIALKIVVGRKQLIVNAVGWNARTLVETLRGEGIVRASRMCRKSEA